MNIYRLLIHCALLFDSHCFHRLKIKRAMPGDTGNYTCVPTVAKTSSVYVHVIIGEYKQPHVCM